MEKTLFIALLFTTFPFAAYADATSTPPAVTTTPDTITLSIRDGNTTAFSGTVTLPDASSSNVTISPTNSSSTIDIPARSVLAVLEAVDASTTDFDITDLAYNSSFNAFIVNCIAVRSGATPDCYDWTDAINGSYPQVGVDHQLLKNGDIVVLYFGSPRQTTVSTSTVEVGTPFTATAQRYDLDSGQYVAAQGVTLGVGTPNPDFSFTELATSTTDSNGQAIFTLNATGTFSVGIKEDFYFPSVSITITNAAATTSEATSTPPATPIPSSGGSVGGGGISHLQFNVQRALAYLATQQHADGSFGSSLVTDWAAIALGAADLSAEALAQTGPGQAKTKLRSYLLVATTTVTSVTDYERHAMALEAIGINPYNDTATDYISPIVNAFDGTQIGDASLDNDDIFAILALLRAGYGPGDTIIQKTGLFILSKQQPNGSWDGSADMTAAAVQALGSLFGTSGISSRSLGQALGMAAGYLASAEQPDASWSNVDSTSWVQIMINAMNAMDPTRASLWPSSAGYYPADALAGAQQQDGAVRPLSDSVDNRVWSTSYAVVAESGTSWLTLPSFAKPNIAPTSGGGGVSGSVLGVATFTSATSTPTILNATSTGAIATSTQSVATSTPVIIARSTIVTATQTTPKKSIIKKPKQKTIPQPLAEPKNMKQIAAAAYTSGDMFSKILSAIAWFFSKIF